VVHESALGSRGHRSLVAGIALSCHEPAIVSELRERYDLKVDSGHVHYIKAVTSAGGLRNHYLAALPHLEELETEFGLTSKRGDPNHAKAVASAGGLRETYCHTYLAALPHLLELATEFSLT